MGEPRTKKNSQQIFINHKTGKPFITTSPAYKDYLAAAAWQLCPCPPATIDRPVNVKCLYYMATRRKVDLTNLLEATDDILVGAHILADDNSSIVVSHDGSRVLYDKARPRVEIEIEEATP